MADNGGTISGRVFKNWHPSAPAGLWVTLNSLTLGGHSFEMTPKRPEAQTTEGGHFALGFSWPPPHVGKIDQHLKAQILVFHKGSVVDKVTIKVGVYVGLGQIWKGMGGPSKARDLPDVVNYWTDVYETLKEVPVPKILKQTGWMSPEAYCLFGQHAKLTISGS